MYEKKKTSFLCINHFLFCHFFMFVWRREYNFLDISALSGKCGNKKIFIFKLFFRRIYCETNHLSYTSFWLFFFFIFQFWKKNCKKKLFICSFRFGDGVWKKNELQVRIVFLYWLPCILRMHRPGREQVEYPPTPTSDTSERKTQIQDVELKER